MTDSKTEAPASTEAPQPSPGEKGEGTTAPAAPAAPAFDIEAYKAEVAAEAKAVAEANAAKLEQQIRSNIAEQLAPSKKKTVDPLLEQIVENPGDVLKNVSDITIREMERRQADAQKQARSDAKAVKPFQDEYPELLEQHNDTVDAVLMANLSKGMERSEAIKAACETVVKTANLKSISERKKEGTYRATAIPGVGGAGYGGEPSFNDVQSSSDYITGLKAQARARRGK